MFRREANVSPEAELFAQMTSPSLRTPIWKWKFLIKFGPFVFERKVDGRRDEGKDKATHAQGVEGRSERARRRGREEHLARRRPVDGGGQFTDVYLTLAQTFRNPPCKCQP